MKDQLKKRLLDLLFVALAGFLGLGAFYVYANVRAHQALDEAILSVIQQQQAVPTDVSTQSQPVETPRAPFDQELPDAAGN